MGHKRLAQHPSNRNRHSFVMALGRNYNLNDRTGIGIGQPETPPEFRDTLPHSANPNSHTVGPQLNDLLLDSLAIVADRNHDPSAVFR